MHDEKTLIFQNIRRLLALALALVGQESSHCSSLDIDTPFLKVVDGSDHGRDVLTPMHAEKHSFPKHSSLAGAGARACGARELSR